MNLLVTHISPDIDAVASCWLIRKYYPGWQDAQLEFVPAGGTLNKAYPDNNSEIIHVDTGMGMFDHHQSPDRTSAAEKVFLFLKEEKSIPHNDLDALLRIVEVIVSVDHFEEIFLDQPDADIHDFNLYALLNGIGLKDRLRSDKKVIEFGESALDALLINIKNKIHAEKTIAEGHSFKTYLGKTLAIESENDECIKLAMKKGFDMVIRKSRKQSYVRIKLHPKVKSSLKKIYLVIKKADPDATWFYHSSGKMLLNGSSKKPDSVPSHLSLDEVIRLVTSIK
ncbi:hypothetical protein A3D06_01460 [Candidatus Roizmanbacteria bacterium RIFCSPHIGHO2_02_FULL_40_9]|uniref:Uncharacterized protein n=2 Tax=Candidatus Roizmaniibacteriota TaxID=1752723 RepID=A0A1F7IMI8_9BACT|nr:MAG: hypothetical protein A3D06_01460 [Candidatus Roizmanbacteria bacterium RIFCSPHIGHO2_02_FULL_40_9]OGK44520.1 MAG: hypothetical protein A2957_00600 [Candidatus Roizmanbacteria bacterium RIFCSPLOWO2_01_FULL_38_11]